MDAKTFLDKHGRDVAERVAVRAGTNYVYFTQIASGHRQPSPGLAKRLVKASDGELTLAELRSDLWGVESAA